MRTSIIMPTSRYPIVASSIHLIQPTESLRKATTRTYVIYFVTGNPGLIEYYRTFLTHLFGLLLRNGSYQDSIDFQVYGRSLPGFETEGDDDGGRTDNKRPPFGLQDQIQHSQDGLIELVESIKRKGSEDVRVILMGHSVGSYILLEIMRCLREKALQNSESKIRIVGGVCLFPTVVDIAKSPNGRKASWMLTMRPFALVVSLFAKVLTLFIRTTVLTYLIRAFMWFPTDSAYVTASFATSPHGIRQALHMAGDEMREITIDEWDSEIWGAAHVSSHPHPRPILRFLFAKKDHWVADETRDELIRARGRAEDIAEGDGQHWKPAMEVDEEEGWPHAFCIRHSVPVAERVRKYVEDIIEADMKDE